MRHEVDVISTKLMVRLLTFSRLNPTEII